MFHVMAVTRYSAGITDCAEIRNKIGIRYPRLAAAGLCERGYGRVLQGVVLLIVALFIWAQPAGAFSSGVVEVLSAGKTHKFVAEIAETAGERQQGLMNRQALPLNAGMLFIFPQSGPIQMWMKDTYISLDMIFADAAGRIVNVVPRTQPQSLTIISSGAPAKTVFEVRGGTAERLGIMIGDQIRLNR